MMRTLYASGLVAIAAFGMLARAMATEPVELALRVDQSLRAEVPFAGAAKASPVRESGS